jgi:hypothetical protein
MVFDMSACAVRINGSPNARAENAINWLIAPYDPGLVIVHGGAAGIDQSFAVACWELGVTAEAHLADWRGLGNIGGPARYSRDDSGRCRLLYRVLPLAGDQQRNKGLRPSCDPGWGADLSI